MQPESEVCASESDLRIPILSWDVVDSLIKQLNIMMILTERATDRIRWSNFLEW